MQGESNNKPRSGKKATTVVRESKEPSHKGSQGVRAFGLRKARYLGLAQVHLQHILMATAINLLRLFAWSSGIPLAETRISRFAALAPD